MWLYGNGSRWGDVVGGSLDLFLVLVFTYRRELFLIYRSRGKRSLELQLLGVT